MVATETNSKPILIIDDEDFILELGKQFLQRSGYTVFTADNCQKGIAQYLEVDIGLIILDLGLPGVSGIQCMKEILSADGDANIIIASGDLSNGRVQEALKIGAKAFLAKPFSLTELLKTVREVLDKSREEKPV